MIVEEDDDKTCVLSLELLPGFHPEVGWFVNHNEDWNAPMFQNLILDRPIETVTTFYKYNFNTLSLELLLTCGCHCPIHSRPLCTRADPYPCPTLTKKQKFTFTPNQPFTRLVDHAIALKKDDTLRAKIICYCVLNIRIYNSTLHITEIQKDLFELQKQHCNSTITLTEANAYNRLALRVIFKDPPTDAMTMEEVHCGRNCHAFTPYFSILLFIFLSQQLIYSRYS
jgi:hypothetical protein